MANGTRVKKGNPCPVCQQESKCVILSHDLSAVICWRTRDQYECPPGWRFVKAARDDMGGVIVATEERREFSPEEKKEWGRKQAAIKQQREAEQTARLSKLLSIKDRDHNYKKIINQLNLSEIHQNKLFSRGLLISEINQLVKWGWVRTWEPQKVIVGVDTRLPGIARNQQLAGAKGFVIFKQDVEGHTVGGEIALDVRTEGKYKPLTSAFCGGNGPHLPNGELPITVWQHPDKTGVSKVIITEGSLKSLVTAMKYWRYDKNVVVIGKQVVGGSHQTTNDYISYLVEKFNISSVAIASDAGVIHHKGNNPNYHILAAYRQIVTTGQEKNPQVEWSFLWWGQTAKSPDKTYPGCDVDELSDFNLLNCKNIGLSDFFGMAKEKQQPTYNINDNNVDKEPDPAAYAEYLAYEARESLIEAEDKKESFVINFFKFLPKVFRSKSSRQHYNTVAQECLVPTKQFLGSINKSGAQWTYTQGQDAEIYEAAIAAGYKYILNQSGTGAGKTTAIAHLLNPQSLGEFKYLFYLHPSHRNPVVGKLEDSFFDLPTRHNGLIFDHTKRTGNGNPHIIRPRTPEEKDNTEIESNCRYADLFQTCQSNNLDGLLGEEICKACPHFVECQHSVGTGFGFKHQRRIALQNTASRGGFVRAHIASLPKPDDWDYSKSVAVLDEPKAWLEPHQTFTVTKKDVTDTWVTVEKHNPTAFALVKTLIAEVYDLWDLNDKQLGRFGWDDYRTRAKLLNSVTELSSAQMKQIADDIEGLFMPDLSWLKESQDEIDTTGMSDKEKRMMKAASRALKSQTALSAEESMKKIDDQLLKNWLPDLLRVLAGDRGSMAFKRNGLQIAITNKRNQQILDSFGASIFLDATIHPDDLASTLGVDISDICLICQNGFHQEVPHNLTINQILGFGQLGKQRSQSQIDRLAVLSNELSLAHKGRIGVIDWKDHSPNTIQNFTNLTWFAGSRGSNLFEGKEALQINGLPYPNMGAIAVRYQMVSGESIDLSQPTPGFIAYYRRCIQEEIWQAIGRLRAGRRVMPLTCYLVFDDPDFDLDWLGCDVNKINASEIHPLAGSAIDRNRYLVVEALQRLNRNLIVNRRTFTQAKVAAEAKIAQSTISELSGGRWNEIIKTVIKNGRGEFDKIYSLLGGKEQRLVDQLRQVELAQIGDNAQRLAEIIKQYGWKVVSIALQGLDDVIKSSIIDGVMGLLPFDKKREMVKLYLA